MLNSRLCIFTFFFFFSPVTPVLVWANDQIPPPGIHFKEKAAAASVLCSATRQTIRHAVQIQAVG